MTSVPAVFLGVDVQVRRLCAYVLLDEHASQIGAGWLPSEPPAAAAELRRLASDLGAPERVAVGIDAPRAPLDIPRVWSWGRSAGWTPCGESAKGLGRHCEIVIKALGLANPQWTPLAADAPDWMRLGFRLFDALRDFPHVYEVFPSAAYSQLHAENGLQVRMSFAAFSPGPKDMLDALLSAFVVREYTAGRGSSVGNGDHLGAIILPRPLRPGIDARLHHLPSTRQAAI